jgi:putative toxin-antitoxin system antitoxin component (TIGR02293 family)
MPLPNISENIPPAPHYISVTAKLGVPTIQSEDQLAALVQDQLPTTTLKSLEENGILDTEIYSLVIPRRTLAHRKAKKERLSVDESDRAVRIARVTSLAEEILGDSEKAFRWLRKPKMRFNGRSPMSMLLTESGTRLVEDLLYGFYYGMLA